jgi:hypothetical protein
MSVPVLQPGDIVLLESCGIFNLGHLFQRLFLDLEGYGHYAPE